MKPLYRNATEILGRSLLVHQLTMGGLEVAAPLCDRGVDLIAWLWLPKAAGMLAVPIQLKAAAEGSFSLDRKYERIPNLVLAYVWRVKVPARALVFALSYPEAVSVAQDMGYTRTESWAQGHYVVTRPGRKLLERLEPHRMEPQLWKSKLRTIAGLGWARAAASGT